MIQVPETFSSYLQAQWTESRPAATTIKRAVTISRQAGSGAKGIATELARYLEKHAAQPAVPWMTFDKELVEQVLEEHHLPHSLAVLRPEDRVPRIEDMIEEVLGALPPSHQFVRQTAETILKLAHAGNVIIIGRGANVVTAPFPHILHVRLVSSFDKRVQRIQGYDHCDRKAAMAFIKKADTGRRRYLETYFHKNIDDPLLYHLTINTDFFTEPAAAKIIGDAVLSL
jgi:cytidylate kinase